MLLMLKNKGLAQADQLLVRRAGESIEEHGTELQDWPQRTAGASYRLLRQVPYLFTSTMR
jgi:hypothetical protein